MYYYSNRTSNSIVSKMIIKEDLQASHDQPTQTIEIARQEPSLLQTLADFAASTVAICLFAAFVVLLFITMNVAVAVIATGTVFVVIMTVVALVVLAGFKNGMYEAIFTIICVGMSIDYAVHLSHFYNNAVGTRYEKTRDAIHGVGVSVIGGAITTMGAVSLPGQISFVSSIAPIAIAVRDTSWLIDAVNQRSNTLLRVVRVVLERQREF